MILLVPPPISWFSLFSFKPLHIIPFWNPYDLRSSIKLFSTCFKSIRMNRMIQNVQSSNQSPMLLLRISTRVSSIYCFVLIINLTMLILLFMTFGTKVQIDKRPCNSKIWLVDNDMNKYRKLLIGCISKLYT